MSDFSFNSLFNALPPTDLIGSGAVASSLFNQEILHEMLSFCSRPQLELYSTYSSTLYHLIKNYFPTAPYRSFHQLSISISQGRVGLKLCKEKNQTFHLFKNNAKARRSRKQRGEPVSYDTPFHMLYPLLKASTIQIQETILNLDKDDFVEPVQQQLSSLAHLWAESRFTLEVTQLSRSENCSEKYHSLLKQVLSSHLLKCDELVLKFNFPTVELKLNWPQFQVLYECKVLELDNFNHCISKQELALILDGIPKRHQENLLIIFYFNYFNSEMHEKQFDFNGFLEITKTNFVNSIKPQLFELRIVFFNCKKIRVKAFQLINEFSRESMEFIEEQNFKGYTLKRSKLRSSNIKAGNYRKSLQQICLNDLGSKFI